MSAATGTSSPLWDEWFDTQFDLNDAIDRVIKERSAGKGDGFRVALYSSVIENAAENMRAFIPDLTLDAKPAAVGAPEGNEPPLGRATSGPPRDALAAAAWGER